MTYHLAISPWQSLALARAILDPGSLIAGAWHDLRAEVRFDDDIRDALAEEIDGLANAEDSLFEASYRLEDMDERRDSQQACRALKSLAASIRSAR